MFESGLIVLRWEGLANRSQVRLFWWLGEDTYARPVVLIRCVSKDTGLASDQIDIVIHFRLVENVHVLLACLFVELLLIRFHLNRLLSPLDSPLLKDHFLELWALLGAHLFNFGWADHALDIHLFLDSVWSQSDCLAQLKHFFVSLYIHIAHKVRRSKRVLTRIFVTPWNMWQKVQLVFKTDLWAATALVIQDLEKG